MFERVYLGPGGARARSRGSSACCETLFDHYAEDPPPRADDGARAEQRVVDWLAGMTDRFAVRDVRRRCRCREGS